MTVTVKLLCLAKYAENTQTTQYTAVGVRAIIDKFTALNAGVSATTIKVNLPVNGESPSNSNLIASKTLQSGEAYTFPELVGHVLDVGGYISTLAGASNAINFRVSGREVTS